MARIIGILGFGIVGRSAVKFLHEHKQQVVLNLFEGQQSLEVSVWNHEAVNPSNTEFSFFSAEQISLDGFIAQHDYIIPSPGFDLNNYDFNDKRFLCELDLFAHFFSTKTIALTGTLGKTTITSMVHALLSEYKPYKVLLGGNIGVGMLDLIDQQKQAECAVLELSSFQLERSKSFAPDIGVLTNCYENHLDRHKIMQEYVAAKLKLFAYQDETQYAIIPFLFAQEYGSYLTPLRSHVVLFSSSYVDNESIKAIDRLRWSLLDLHDGWLTWSEIFEGVVVKQIKLMLCNELPENTFFENWFVIIAVLRVFGLKQDVIKKLIANQVGKATQQKHRLEKIATIRGVDFYNDSKATVMQAAMAAIAKLAESGRSVTLILGGLDKGVDRSSFIKTLESDRRVNKIYALGSSFTSYGSIYSFSSLQVLLDDVIATMEPGDQILFSPGGSSFDLFDNYEHRGQVFTKLVLERVG